MRRKHNLITSALHCQLVDSIREPTFHGIRSLSLNCVHFPSLGIEFSDIRVSFLRREIVDSAQPSQLAVYFKNAELIRSENVMNTFNTPPNVFQCC